MDFRLRISLLISLILYFSIILHLLKRKLLNLKYSLLWLFMGAVMLVLSIFPYIMELFCNLIGIVDAVNGLFAIIIFCIMLILMSITAIVSKLRIQNKDLTQYIALLEKRVRELENLK